MRQTRFLFLALLLSSSLLAQENDPVVTAILREGKENSQVMEHLDHLVNKIGPRLTSSDRCTQACEWARDQFKSFGLDNARLEEWGKFNVGFNRGPWSGAMTAPEEKPLVCATMAWTAGTNGPVEGPALLPPATVEDAKDHYKGAWLVAPGRLSDEVLNRLEEIGIAGIVRSSRSDLIVTDGNHRIKWDRLPKRVTVFLTKTDHKEITVLLESGKEVRLKFDIKHEFKKGPIPLYNVIADLRGTEKPEEIVIVGGHIDSWDGATGTVDNGTGVATTLEAARLLMKAGAKPKRTIRFMLWSGEEQGCLGSYGWIQKHKDELKNISCVLVHDGGTNYVSGLPATPSTRPIFEKAFAPVLSLDESMKFKIRDVRKLPYPIGSDHDSFLSAGVPGLYWNQSGKANYTHAHHTQHDTFDQAIPEYQRHSAVVIAAGAWGLANAETLLPREGLPGKEAPEGHGRRMLGVSLEDDGVTVASVTDGSPAAKAGVREGDKILSVGDRSVTRMEELLTAVREAKRETTVTVLRDGKSITLAVELKD